MDWPGSLAHLLLNLRSCEFTQRHVWLMKMRIWCNIAGCFTTSQPTAFLWRECGGVGWGKLPPFPYGVATVSRYDSCLCLSCWGVARTAAEAVPCIDNCAFVWRWGASGPLTHHHLVPCLSWKRTYCVLGTDRHFSSSILGLHAWNLGYLHKRQARRQ